MDLAEEKENLIIDLNLEAEEPCSSGLGFQFPATESGSGCDGDLRRTEREDSDVEIVDCSARKRIKYTVEEKGKGKIDYTSEVNLDLNLTLGASFGVVDLDDDRQEERDVVLGRQVDVNVIDLSSDSDDDVVRVTGINLSAPSDHGGEFLSLGSVSGREVFTVNVEPQDPPMTVTVVEEEINIWKDWEETRFKQKRLQALSTVMTNKHRRKEEAMQQRRLAREVAQRFAHLDPNEQRQEEEGIEEKRMKLSVDSAEEWSGGDGDDSGSPFSLAIEEVRKRVKGRKKLDSLLKWVPADKKSCNVVRKRDPPTLLDLSLSVLAKNAEAIVSLDYVPDVLRNRISQLVCDSRKVNAHFIKLLASGCPTEICVKDISQLTEEEFDEIFGDCDTTKLNVLQLDLCGRCMPDYVLLRTLSGSSNRLAALTTLSLRGAHRLTNTGLASIAKSAPRLQSINLSQCSLLTSHGIIDLASSLKSTLRELYMDDCQNVDFMIILPSLKKLKRLEVLSVAGIQTVTDEFVIEMVKACGMNMRELVFSNCVRLTDLSLKFVGKLCPNLRALDLCYLHKLTDVVLKYLANGCQSIHSLKLCRNGFSDEAIAAFLEAAGESLTVLSLNYIREVSHNTAFSIAKCSKNLLSLDLSWCRKLTDESLGLIVDSCMSVKLLKLFGCSQITDVFLNGHSNNLVKIIGCKTEDSWM